MNTSRKFRLIQTASIASPCDMKWDDMTGDDKVRHCKKCQLNVYNFREMTASETNTLLEKASGRICGQLWRRFDGTIITKDCPEGVAAIRWKLIMATAKIAAIVVMLFTAVGYGRARDSETGGRYQTAYGRTTIRVEKWLAGPPSLQNFIRLNNTRSVSQEMGLMVVRDDL